MFDCSAKASLFAKRKGVLRGGEADVASSIEFLRFDKGANGGTVPVAWTFPNVQAWHVYVRIIA